jgi:hypothetical protein
MDIPYNNMDRLIEIINARDTTNNKMVLNMRVQKMIDTPLVLKNLGFTAAKQLMEMTPRQLEQRIIDRIPNVPMDALNRFIKPFTMDHDGNLGINWDNFKKDEYVVISRIVELPQPLQDQAPMSRAWALYTPAAQFPPPHTMVQMDELSSSCLYCRDPIRTDVSFIRTVHGTQYNLATLFCLTPSGFGSLHDLKMGEDFIIHPGRHLQLKPSHVKQISFGLTSESSDHPRVTLEFANGGYTIPFNSRGVTESLHIYVPPNQQNAVIHISYHSDYVDVQLTRIAAWQLNADVIPVDPTSMIAQFAGDMRNVHLHANVQLPQCPMEQLVSARVNFERLTEPICSFLDNLFASTAVLGDKDLKKYAVKIPYIYNIHMQTMTCTRTRMVSHELERAIPLVTVEEFASFNATTTPDGLNIEQHLIRYTMFQMMLSYRKFTWDEFLTCPVHHITFDLYLRRGAGEVGYHYDLTPGNIVSSVGLLYSMPPDHVKMGPQLIPRRYRTDASISDTNVVPMSAFIMRNSAILFNNVTWSHTTPHVENFISRMPYQVSYEVKNSRHQTIYNSALNVTHDPITIPASIRAKLTQSSVNPSRTFLRSWHIVDISSEQMANLGITEDVVFSMPFLQMATRTMEECFAWVSAAGCMCIEVGMDPATGEIIPPTKLPGHLRGGRIPQLHFGSSPKTPKIKTQLKSKSKTQHSSASSSSKKIASPISPIRASTVSITHMKQQIGSKLKKIRAVLKNPKKNFVVMSGPRTRSRSQSYTQNASKTRSRSRTRKVRSAN